jgi:hypothetical protein
MAGGGVTMQAPYMQLDISEDIMSPQALMQLEFPLQPL